ncbi:MAG: glycine betaine ABC transporter substrate-binding protein, partial [Actinomycetota bacterium]
MRSARTRRALFAGVALASLLAACGDDSGSDGGAAITLAANPWTGSAVNAYVAQAIIQAELGTTVNITDIDENATWLGLDDGSIDAVLEVWPSG